MPAGALGDLLGKMKPKGEKPEAEPGDADFEKLRSLAEEAFPGEWPDERLTALKEFIHSCVEGGY